MMETRTTVASKPDYNLDLDWFRQRNYHLYSAEETVQRAYERLGEDKYSLLFNNCEHFAIWCKTGISQSHQVEEIINNKDLFKKIQV